MNACPALHHWLHSLERCSFPFPAADIPKNGLYVLFERDEHGHGGDRIVRVGTHTGQDQLPSRLQQHFLRENKDRSIFRKNIGRAILNLHSDPFLSHWNLDLTTRKQKEAWAGKIDMDYQQKIEGQVTSYIQNQFSFVVLPVEEKQDRLFWEKKIIATVARCPDCRVSKEWLGRFSPVKEIRQSGLWLVQHLMADPLAPEELEALRRLV